MPLGSRGELQEQLLGLGLGEVLPGEGEARGESPDEGGGRGPESARGWDAVDGGELDVVDREVFVRVDGGVAVLDKTRIDSSVKVWLLFSMSSTISNVTTFFGSNVKV